MASNKHPDAQVHTFNTPFEFETAYLGQRETIPVLDVGYESWGDPSHPAILVCHALTGNTHAHDPKEPDNQRVAWWNAMVGPSKPIDTRKFFVICINMLGGCGGSSGPASLNPDTGETYGLHFPVVTVGDMVRVQKLLLDALGVKKLHAVIGGSLGGFQVLEWAVMFPALVERAIVVASSAYSNQFMIMTNRAQIDAIQLDANYKEGRYTKEAPPDAGLTVAREIGFTTFISPLMMEKKFTKYHDSVREPFTDAQFHLQRFHEAENYLHHVAVPFGRDFDANSIIYLLQTWNHFDLAVEHGTLAAAFEPVQARMLVMSATGDNLFPPYLSENIVAALKVNGKSVRNLRIEDEYGHDFFLIPEIVTEKLDPPIRAFLAE